MYAPLLCRVLGNLSLQHEVGGQEYLPGMVVARHLGGDFERVQERGQFSKYISFWESIFCEGLPALLTQPILGSIYMSSDWMDRMTP